MADMFTDAMGLLGFFVLIMLTTITLGLVGLVAFGFGAKIYSNIKQMLLERESVGHVQNTKQQ